MKKKTAVCMAMAAMLALGSVSAYGAVYDTIPHTFTAKVGTTDFRKDGKAQPLDVPIYIKDGYTMLPLRTFMDAALENAHMTWDGEKQQAWVINGSDALCFDMRYNTITRNSAGLPVYGKQEVRDGRVFVPLRNWGMILEKMGFVVGEADITWDHETQTATVKAGEKRLLDVNAGLEKPVISGEGQQADFALEPTTAYDGLKNAGDGYFIATKEGREDSDRQDDLYAVLDAKTGRVTAAYEAGTRIRDFGEGCLQVEQKRTSAIVTDREGNPLFEAEGVVLGRFSEGLAMVMRQNAKKDHADFGYIDTAGKKVIPMQFYDASDFSEGLAAVCTRDDRVLVDGRPKYFTEWGYIDKQGKMVIAAKYRNAAPFYEGLARVQTEKGYGYIDRDGKEVIPCQYRWGGYFRNGVTYVLDERKNTWLINRNGEKLKKIAEGHYVFYANDNEKDVQGRKNGILLMEEIVELPGGGTHVYTYYDETGQISREEYLLRMNFAEGLAPYLDKETDRYGYVDERGNWVIAPVFTIAEPFEDGYAVVAQKAKTADGMVDAAWGIIQHPGK